MAGSENSVSLVPISWDAHRSSGFVRPSSFSFASENWFASTTIQELPKIVSAYPVFFVPDSSEHFHMIALLGLQKNRNLFVSDQGKWMGGYVPACFRVYPFKGGLMRMGSETRHVMCFDVSSGLLVEDPDPEKGEIPIFIDEHKMNPILEEGSKFLGGIRESSERTDKCLSILADLGVFVPSRFSFSLPEMSGDFVGGLHIINFEKLQNLSASVLKDLMRCGALELVYLHRYSLAKIELLKKLLELKNQKQLEEQDWSGVEMEDDEFSFQFDFRE